MTYDKSILLEGNHSEKYPVVDNNFDKLSDEIFEYNLLIVYFNSKVKVKYLLIN